jgi:hypothetical protein
MHNTRVCILDVFIRSIPLLGLTTRFETQKRQRALITRSLHDSGSKSFFYVRLGHSGISPLAFASITAPLILSLWCCDGPGPKYPCLRVILQISWPSETSFGHLRNGLTQADTVDVRFQGFELPANSRTLEERASDPASGPSRHGGEWNDRPLARLQIGRAYAMEGDAIRARKA